MVQVQLLGGVGAATQSGVPLEVGPAKCQLLLAALALAVNEPVPVARLIDVLWDEAPPRTADKTLQGYVAQLRRGLGREVVARVGAAYRLDLDPEHLDAARFRRRLTAGDVDGALAAWTGTPLAGLDAAGLRPAVDGLVEQWLGAVARPVLGPSTVGLDLPRDRRRCPPEPQRDLAQRVPGREPAGDLFTILEAQMPHRTHRDRGPDPTRRLDPLVHRRLTLSEPARQLRHRLPGRVAIPQLHDLFRRQVVGHHPPPAPDGSSADQ